MHDTGFNYPFITSILKSPKYRNWSVQKYFIDVVLSRSEIKFIHSLGERVNFWKQNLQNLARDGLCLLFSCNLIGYFK